MDALALQELLADKLGERESRELLRYISDRPDLVTKDYLDKSMEILEHRMETLEHRMNAKMQSEFKDFALKIAGFLVAQAAVIITLIKLL